jgi:hypothetical protein
MFTLQEMLIVASVMSVIGGITGGIRAAALGEAIWPAVLTGAAFAFGGTMLSYVAPFCASALGVIGLGTAALTIGVELAEGNYQAAAVDVSLLVLGAITGQAAFKGLQKLGAIPVTEVHLRLNKIYKQAVQKVDNQGIAAFTPNQREALRRYPQYASKLWDLFRGNRIHALARDMAMRDPTISKYGIICNWNKGPDFAFVEKKVWWDITKARDWVKHVAKYKEVFGKGISLLHK